MQKLQILPRPEAGASPPASPAAGRSISLRSIVLGLAGVVLICGLTPYNDYALNNTFLVGNNLPLGVMLLTFLLVVLVNAPLSRWRPAWALTSGELTVVFSMTLVSCALPSSGLMRYLPAALVVPFSHAQDNVEFGGFLQQMDLAGWLFPSFASDDRRLWMTDPLVSGFTGRLAPEDPIPWAAWVRPALAWGVFLGLLYAALLCMVCLVRRQWYDNERLPFPLAQIQLSLIEQPRPGHWFNSVLSQRSFWIAAAAVFALHAWNGLSRYFPRYFPEIWVYYNFHSLFTERPWTFVDTKIKDAAVFFSAVGVTYFLRTPVALSLWFFYIAHQFYRVYLGYATGDPTPYGQQDQHLGGILALMGVMLWVGRRHWGLVLAQAVRGHRPGEPAGRYIPYPIAFWGLIGAAAGMVMWLAAAGASWPAAALVVVLLLVLFLAIMRIIAETGLIHGQLQVPLFKPWAQLVLAGVNRPVSLETFYLTSLLQAQHYDFREVVPVYASHGVKLADQTFYGGRPTENDPPSDRRAGRQLIALMALALLVGYFVSFSSMLWTEYRHAWTKDALATKVNGWGSDLNPRYMVVDATVTYAKEQYVPKHSFVGHLSFGIAFTSFLALLRLRYTWFPLHPIGYIMVPTYPGAHLWLSIFVGWLCKVTILRFGGARTYTAAKPFFVGLIVGESLAAAFWLVVGIVLSAMDLTYRPVNIMPG